MWRTFYVRLISKPSIAYHPLHNPQFPLSYPPFLIHSTLGILSMNKFKIALPTTALLGLFYCVKKHPKKEYS